MKQKTETNTMKSKENSENKQDEEGIPLSKGQPEDIRACLMHWEARMHVGFWMHFSCCMNLLNSRTELNWMR